MASAWTIETLPEGCTAAYCFDASTGAYTYVLQLAGAVSDPLDPSSASFQTDLDTFVNDHLPPTPSPTDAEIAAAWVQLRMIRDRWLSQCQVVFDEIKTPGSQDLSDVMLDGIAANSDGWLEWRQAMRDLPQTPGTPGVDPVDAVAAIKNVHSTADTFPAPWPQPPAAPVIHLT